jgi:hypothetical protein
MGPDEVAQKIARSFPVAGPQLDRFRKYAIALRTDGEERAAQNLLEAFALTAPTGMLIREAQVDPRSPQGMLRMGFESKERRESYEDAAEIRDLDRAHKTALSHYAMLVVSGKRDEAQAFQESFDAKYGDKGLRLRLTPAAIKGARERLTLPSMERALKHSSKDVRRYRLEQEALAEDED